VTYTSPRHWLPGFEPAPQQEALTDVLRRYLFAYGPATPQQFARWLGISATWAARAFEALGAEAVPVELEGTTSWMIDDGSTPAAGEPRGTRLLPYFDAYAVGCYPRELLFPGRAFQRALTGGQAGNVPVLLIEGIVRGVWHQRRSGSKVAITVESFVDLSARHRREIDAQVERIGAVLEASASWTTGEVTVGPHA
jgi:hypothetical protein